MCRFQPDVSLGPGPRVARKTAAIRLVSTSFENRPATSSAADVKPKLVDVSPARGIQELPHLRRLDVKAGSRIEHEHRQPVT